MSVIDEVKQKIDISEVISQYTTLKKAGRNLTALCPFHNEKNPSFFVYPEQQSWHCFGACNTGGDIFSFLMKKENMDFGEALRLLAQRVGVTIPSRSDQDTKRDEKEKLYQINESAAQYFNDILLNSPSAEKARNYLSKRDISQETVSDFRLGFSLNNWGALKNYLLDIGYNESEILESGLIISAEDGKTHDRFRNRLVFPIVDIRGRITGFGARVLDDSLPKYVNSPQSPVFDKSSSLYSINLAAPAIRQQNQAVIVEGYIDVIIAHQNGFSNVVASMGTSVTESQVSTLKRLSKNIALALDADAAGEEAMLRCVDYENSLDAELKVIILPEGKDPDDVIREDSPTWQKLLDEAIPVVDYTFNTVASTLDMKTASDKRAAFDRLGPVVRAINNPLRQAHYVQKLARLVNVNERTIEATLSRVKPTRKTQIPKSEEMVHTVQPLFSHPLEEECLALLLQHPELKNRDEGLLPEYFENTQNREIFIAWQQADDLDSLRDKLDDTLWEHLDNLINKNILATQLDERYNDYVLGLRKEYYRSLERKKEASLALVAESEGTTAELAKLKQQGIEATEGLREIFNEKYRRGRGQRR